MNKSSLIDMVREKTSLSKKDSEKAVNAVIDSITESMSKGQKVKIVGFGTFEVRHRKEREGRNPATGEIIKIKAFKVPAFKPSEPLKQKVSESRTGTDDAGPRTGGGGPGRRGE